MNQFAEVPRDNDAEPIHALRKVRDKLEQSASEWRETLNRHSTTTMPPGDSSPLHSLRDEASLK